MPDPRAAVLVTGGRQPEVRSSNRLRTTVCTAAYASIRFSAGRPGARATGERALSPPLVRTRPAGRAASALERPGPEFGRHRGDAHPPPMHAQGARGRGVMANATRPRHERDRTLRIRGQPPPGRCRALQVLAPPAAAPPGAHRKASPIGSGWRPTAQLSAPRKVPEWSTGAGGLALAAATVRRKQ